VKRFNWVKRLASQKGEIALVGAIVSGIVGVVVIGLLVVNLWPTFLTSITGVAALTATDTATTTLKGIWPLVGVVAGIGVPVAAVIYVLHHFDII
jgi:hypothetical protein